MNIDDFAEYKGTLLDHRAAAPAQSTSVHHCLWNRRDWPNSAYQWSDHRVQWNWTSSHYTHKHTTLPPLICRYVCCMYIGSKYIYCVHTQHKQLSWCLEQPREWICTHATGYRVASKAVLLGFRTVKGGDFQALILSGAPTAVIANKLPNYLLIYSLIYGTWHKLFTLLRSFLQFSRISFHESRRRHQHDCTPSTYNSRRERGSSPIRALKTGLEPCLALPFRVLLARF